MFTSRYIDETFDINNCQNYILSIQCALDGFSFSIYDTGVDKFIFLGEIQFITATPFQLKNEIIDLINTEPCLQQKFKRVNCVYMSNKLMLAPKTLINSDEYSALFNLSFEQTRNENIISDGSHTAYKLLSGIPGIIKNYFFEHYNNCYFYTPLSAILLYSTHNSSLYQQLFVFKSGHTLYVMAINKEYIEFANSFFVKNNNDCLFYLLSIAKEIKATKKTEICLMGEIEPKSPLPVSLKKYFSRVYMAKYDSRYAVSYTFLQDPENIHVPLIELALCE